MSKKEKKVKETTPEKEAQKSLIVKCVAALLCAVIVCISLNSAFGKIAEAVKESESIVPVAGVVNGGSVSTDDNADVNTDVPSDVPSDDTTADVPADDTATDAAPDATEPAGDTDATQAPSDNKTDTPASKAPQTKEEVVAYFNTAVNKVKTSAKTVEQKEVTNYLASATTISSGIKGVYNMLGGDEWLDKMLKDNSQGAATYTGADIKAKFPVEGEAWASKLTAADVSSATCSEKNGVYTIKVTTIADAKSDSIKHGQGHAPKAFNVILPGVVNDNIPGIATNLVGTASMNYPASTATITVDAKTGNVLTAEYDLKWTINFDKMGIVLPFGSKSVYTIKW